MGKKGQRAKAKKHPMMPVWRKRIGDEIKRRRGSGDKQEAYAARIGISRQQLSIIELGKRSYTVDPLIQALAGVSDDPVMALLEMSGRLNSLDADDIKACYALVEALSAGERKRRTLARNLIKTLADEEEENTSRKGN